MYARRDFDKQVLGKKANKTTTTTKKSFFSDSFKACVASIVSQSVWLWIKVARRAAMHNWCNQINKFVSVTLLLLNQTWLCARSSNAHVVDCVCNEITITGNLS